MSYDRYKSLLLTFHLRAVRKDGSVKGGIALILVQRRETRNYYFYKNISPNPQMFRGKGHKNRFLPLMWPSQRHWPRQSKNQLRQIFSPMPLIRLGWSLMQKIVMKGFKLVFTTKFKQHIWLRPYLCRLLYHV